MAIWFKKVEVAETDRMQKGTMLETLDIRMEELGDDYLKGSMPVDHRFSRMASYTAELR